MTNCGSRNRLLTAMHAKMKHIAAGRPGSTPVKIDVRLSLDPGGKSVDNGQYIVRTYVGCKGCCSGLANGKTPKFFMMFNYQWPHAIQK